jgi:aminoglycoside phosphotransferase (APT) family kinase protein
VVGNEDRRTWDRLVGDVRPGARIRSVRALSGGIDNEVFVVDLDGDALDHIVVKRAGPGATEILDEWECLEFARRIPIETPERVALDAEGRWFDQPALVMTFLDGHVEVQPADVDEWLGRLAATMATIHATPAEGAPDVVRRAADATTWVRPAFRGGPLTDRAFAALEAGLPRAGWAPVLIHGDFHPCQALWRDGALTGVIDWGDLSIGPRWYEVAYCRTEIALLYGMRLADRLLEHYVAAAGVEPVDLAAFDLMCGMKARRFGHLYLEAYRDLGRRDTLRQFAARLAPFNRRALAELGG